mmetsp:Transcript_3529/g.9005  ORF Transcript_3529/g.9005 Transcript_3529/m.9005 type:complete len:583 (+) Transcript_3529:108-1856(+)
MGKKSKKKGGKADKAARRERLQERREQQLEEVDHDNNQGSNTDIVPRQYFKGDRVWFYPNEDMWGEGDNPNNYRGIVKSVQDGSLDIIPLQSKIDGHSLSVRISLDGDSVFPDFCDMTLRFDMEDRVLCSYDVGWVPRRIKYLWPIGEIKIQGHRIPRSPNDSVPRYKCWEYDAHAGDSVAAPHDDDNCIKKHPSSFRFDAGDRVIFKCQLPSGVDSQHMSSWIPGIVESVDITGMAQFYAMYKCTAEIDGDQYSYFITKDDDACIAKEDADPRERLFDAIGQDCSRNHLMYLVDHFDIDVTLFRNLVVSKAIEYASYQALCWLQHDCNVDILQIKDELGNNVLHKIASSEHTTRFIKEAGSVSKLHPTPEWALDLSDLSDHNEDLMNTRNNDDETWFMVLVKRGDVKALDAILSPHYGIAWDLGYFSMDEEGLSSLEKSVKESNDVIMQCTFDSFVEFSTLYKQCMEIRRFGGTEKELLENRRLSMHLLQGEDALVHAKRLARFFNDWQGCTRQLERNPFTNLVVSGYSSLFELFFQADESLLVHNKYYLSSHQDGKEFIQPELASDVEGSTGEYLRGVDN